MEAAVFRFTDLEGRADDYFFRFPHSIIENGIWATLPTSAQAVLPVIGVHTEAKGLAFPSEERIAGLCGITCKTARAGVKALEDCVSGFTVEHYTTNRGKRAKLYHIKGLPTDGKQYLAFFSRWIHGGNWYMLHDTPTARAVYPVMRHFGYAPDYEDTMADGEDSADYPALYTAREYDFCEAERAVICEHAGITRNSVTHAFKELERAHFISWDDEQGAWRVNRWSTWFFKRDWLNADLNRRGK